MLNFLWSLIEVVVWSLWQICLVLFSLGVYHGWKQGKEKDDAGSSNTWRDPEDR